MWILKRLNVLFNGGKHESLFPIVGSLVSSFFGIPSTNKEQTHFFIGWNSYELLGDVIYNMINLKNRFL
jgi:hypothetical protein